jgi:hypothetical protein
VRRRPITRRPLLLLILLPHSSFHTHLRSATSEHSHQHKATSTHPNARCERTRGTGVHSLRCARLHRPAADWLVVCSRRGPIIATATAHRRTRSEQLVGFVHTAR